MNLYVIAGQFVGTLGDPVLLVGAWLGYTIGKNVLISKMVFASVFTIGFVVSEVILHSQQYGRGVEDIIIHALFAAIILVAWLVVLRKKLVPKEERGKSVE